MSQRRTRGRRNGKRKKQPKVGRWATKDHRNKYADMSKFRHDAYGGLITEIIKPTRRDPRSGGN